MVPELCLHFPEYRYVQGQQNDTKIIIYYFLPQYGPLDFGPPLNVGPPKTFKVKEDPFLYDYSYRKIDNEDYIYDDYYYQDDYFYEENNPKPFKRERGIKSINQ